MTDDCAHDDVDLRCTDSRMRDGRTYRRYLCKCGARFASAEIMMTGPMTDRWARARFDKAELADFLTHDQCRSLLEQIRAGHRSLNLI